MKRHKLLTTTVAIISCSILVQCENPKSKNEETAEETTTETSATLDSSYVEETVQTQEEIVYNLKGQDLEPFKTTERFIVGDTSKKIGRIFGGRLVTSNNIIPWQVALIVKGNIPVDGFFCGGSIINNQWILTAAHCLEGADPMEIQVYSGSADLQSGGKLSDIDFVIIHPDYNNKTLNNDIALIKLKKPLKITDSQKPVELPFNDLSYDLLKPDLKCIVSGWGLTETGQTASQLQMAELVNIRETECSNTYGKGLTNNMICAAKKDKDACRGDSGGPLTIKKGTQTVLIGVVSWGPKHCADKDSAGIYTKVHNYVNWIKKNYM